MCYKNTYKPMPQHHKEYMTQIQQNKGICTIYKVQYFN